MSTGTLANCQRWRIWKLRNGEEEKISRSIVKIGQLVVAFLMSMEEGSSKVWGLTIGLVLNLSPLNNHENFREEITRRHVEMHISSS